MAEEKIYENKIKKYIDNKGCWYVKYFANSFTKKGVPDLLICANGYFLAVEVKAEHGKASYLQIYNRNKIRKAGGISIILYPDKFDEFKHLIECLIDGNLDEALTLQYDFDYEKR